VKPKNVMPVHGELRHLHANAELARLTGIPDERVHVVEDGYVVDLADGVAQVTGRVECGYVFVDGASVGDLTESELKDRRILGEEGFVSVIVVIDSASGKLVSGPEITARGVAEDEKVFEQVRPQLRDALETALRDGVTDTYNLQQVIRRTVGGFVSGKLRRKPMIIPTVLDA
jgi:ribonuclease J